MLREKPLHTLMNGRFDFFQEFLKHPLQIAAVFSSSRFLERHVVEAAGLASAKTIVELGPGAGGTTQAILRAIAQYAKLLSIEINPHLHACVNRIEDDRLIAHLGSAIGLKDIISMYGLNAPEVLISGIPFSTMSHSSGSRILEAICSVLAPGGRFVAYQVSNRVARLCQPFLGAGHMEVELFNIPPMRVYRWKKNYD